jgi:hypothetical protein
MWSGNSDVWREEWNCGITNPCDILQNLEFLKILLSYSSSILPEDTTFTPTVMAG